MKYGIWRIGQRIINLTDIKTSNGFEGWWIGTYDKTITYPSIYSDINQVYTQVNVLNNMYGHKGFCYCVKEYV